MSFHEAFGTVLFSVVGIAFVYWYVRCWFEMLFKCQSIRAYFSIAWGSSGPFIIVNVFAAICIAAFALQWATS